MLNSIPQLGTDLTDDQINFLKSFSKSARRSILQMVANAQSGHPGGSLSTIDYLSLLYAFIIGQTGEKAVVSNGHISPAVYSTLLEMGYIGKEVITDFRKINSIYEGHISRHVPGIEYGTGPLGIGVSVGAAFALAEKLKGTGRKAYGIMGDGECQEGQVHEMIHFAKHHNLSNYILFVDYNKVQLTDSIEKTLSIDIPKTFEAGHWNVVEVDAHDFQSMWKALSDAQNSDKPTVLLGNSIMGKGVDFMEEAGRNNQSDWHGKPPTTEQIEAPLKALELTGDEKSQLEDFRTNNVKWHPEEPEFTTPLTKMPVNTGTPIVYDTGETTDCRSAYGKALLDLAQNNKNVVALTADVKGSVMTKYVSEELPEQYIECGIAEQHMVSAAGGLSLADFVPFASTFGAFLSSRPKDQSRVNDINRCNTKLVATHCGLSVGEDGPTHQSIDDAGCFLGHFNTMVIEPADPNQTDRIIRYIASHYGNFYVRMGRHKFPVVTKEDGSPLYDANYEYEYGKCDIVREGTDLTIAVMGSLVTEAVKAQSALKEAGISAEIVAVTSIKKFDKTITDSIEKTRKVLTVEDHNTLSGLASQLAAHLMETGMTPEKFKSLGVEEYQFSGKSQDLYAKVGLDAAGIEEAAKKMRD